MQSTTGKKKVKQKLQTKKGLITCSKLIINKLWRWINSDDVCFANNEQASLVVFIVVFCFTHAKHNFIKLKLYDNLTAHAVNSFSECAMWN